MTESVIMEDPAEVLTAKEVAALLKCSRAQVYRLRLDGSLMPRYKIFKGEKGWRWARPDVAKYLHGCVIDTRQGHEKPLITPMEILR
jgi:predicted DNA-binding transcriptional regulator AlpA